MTKQWQKEKCRTCRHATRDSGWCMDTASLRDEKGKLRGTRGANEDACHLWEKRT